MEFLEYKSLVQSLAIGKQLPDAVYVHRSALESVPSALTALASRVANALKIPDNEWNVLKLGKRDFKITYLNYPQFDDYAYPSLHECYTVDLAKLSLRKANYSTSDNPPKLHRKESFVLPTNPLFDLFRSITQEGEAAGLFENTRTIGFKKSWEKLIRSKGLKLSADGRLESTNSHAGSILGGRLSSESIEIHRHKTAIARDKLSQPMQMLARHDYLNGDYSVLDYGCGRGDDIRELEAHGIDVSGWDPVHHPEGELQESDLVNLGFVLNVIDDYEERTATLVRAWSYAQKALIVSVMIAGDSVIAQFAPYKDGVLTSRNTFQKYYSQGEFRSYVERTLQEPAIALGQGIFIVFKDKIEEQSFLLERQHIRRDWRQRSERARAAHSPATRQNYLEKYGDLFAHFWETCLELGRVPANDEFELSEQVRRIAGSHANAVVKLQEKYGSELFEEARAKRIEDLIVYFALSHFGRRKPRTHMPIGLQRDVKIFFGTQDEAYEKGRAALFEVGKNEVIARACNEAYVKLSHGEMIEGHSYIFHKDRLGDMPQALRIFVGCATQLFGDITDIHLIKAHMTSGKVSLMRYDNWSASKTYLIERVKVDLRYQELTYFKYGNEHRPSLLEGKESFLV